MTVISLALPLPTGSSSLPGNAIRLAARLSGPVPLFGLAPGGVFQHPDSHRDLVRSYRTVSPLPVPSEWAIGGMVSVALSIALRRLGVTQHPA